MRYHRSEWISWTLHRGNAALNSCVKRKIKITESQLDGSNLTGTLCCFCSRTTRENETRRTTWKARDVP